MKFADYQRLYENLDKYNDEILDGSNLKVEIMEWKIPNLEKVIPKEIKITSIAEVGCFTGDLLANIIINDEKLIRTGYDCNSKAIELAKDKYPEATFTVDDIENSNSHYDLIILSDIIEHIIDDEEFLIKLSKKADALLVNLPLEKCWSNLFRVYGVKDSSGHIRAYSIDDALSLFHKCGWKVKNYNVRWYCETDVYHKLDKKNHSVIKESIKNIVLRNKYLRRKYFASNLFAFLLKDE
jgi:SAM-dependent methyltransferase